MWLDAGLFFVVRREALLNGQARALLCGQAPGPLRPQWFWPALFIAVEPLIMCATSHKTLCTTRDQVPQEPIGPGLTGSVAHMDHRGPQARCLQDPPFRNFRAHRLRDPHYFRFPHLL